VVIDYLHVECIASFPHEADAPLVVYSNAELPLASAPQNFQAVARGNFEITESSRLVQVQELPPGNALDSAKSPNRDIVE